MAKRSFGIFPESKTKGLVMIESVSAPAAASFLCLVIVSLCPAEDARASDLVLKSRSIPQSDHLLYA